MKIFSIPPLVAFFMAMIALAIHILAFTTDMTILVVFYSIITLYTIAGILRSAPYRGPYARGKNSHRHQAPLEVVGRTTRLKSN